MSFGGVGCLGARQIAGIEVIVTGGAQDVLGARTRSSLQIQAALSVGFYRNCALLPRRSDAGPISSKDLRPKDLFAEVMLFLVSEQWPEFRPKPCAQTTSCEVSNVAGRNGGPDQVRVSRS